MALKGEQLYEGKAKKVFASEDPDYVIIDYKDEATAFDGTKKGIIKNKGIVNNRISNLLFDYLEKAGIETHFVASLDERQTLVKHVHILPVEVVVRNIAAGSLAGRLGVEEGYELPGTIIELYYKNDLLHDPMINEYHARVMGWASEEQLQDMHRQAHRINQVLSALFASVDLVLVDFKLEFGTFQGRVILADEISPDTCRLWDRQSGEKLDKDRFRRDMGKEEEAYQEVVRRIEGRLA